MNFFEWLTTRDKTLSTMSATELRAQEMLLESDCNRMQARVGKLAEDKQKVVERGAKDKTPELRRTYAQQFDLYHVEQMMLARQLNIRTKERLTVSRLRMLRESAGRFGIAGASKGLIREGDLATIERLIENDKITSEMYLERLDSLLTMGHEADQAAAGLSSAAQEVMKVWGDMDAGLIKDTSAAFDEAEKRVRERNAADA